MLHVNVHALETHPAVALATLVEQPFPHVPQLAMFVAVFTQLPLQSVGVAAGQLETHDEPTQYGIVSGHTAPQLPQLFRSVVSFTHWPPHCE